MVEPTNKKIGIANQCRILSINRSTFYYKKKPVKPENLDLMRQIDQQYLEHPSFGSRSMRRFLERKGNKINRKRVQRLMRQMGIEAIYPKPRTSIPNPEHKVYPYLLRGMDIAVPNKVWAADITYVPMRRGFMYLVAIMDWHSRKVLSWRVSNTLESDFCVSALEDAIDNYGKPKIFKSSMVSNLTDFMDNFKNRDLFEDSELGELIEQAKAIVSGLSPDDLRSDDIFRHKIAEDMKSVKEQIDTAIEDMPRRRLRLPEAA